MGRRTNWVLFLCIEGWCDKYDDGMPRMCGSFGRARKRCRAATGSTAWEIKSCCYYSWRHHPPRWLRARPRWRTATVSRCVAPHARPLAPRALPCTPQRAQPELLLWQRAWYMTKVVLQIAMRLHKYLNNNGANAGRVFCKRLRVWHRQARASCRSSFDSRGPIPCIYAKLGRLLQMDHVASCRCSQHVGGRGPALSQAPSRVAPTSARSLPPFIRFPWPNPLRSC